ncbi:lycopene beta-cyclase CrtY [Aureimonas altamirensis]|uniref:lycopene beta-cyclase CrtY n=1 Tax=Aureimonas altamirensis TaxID=370622 RepID=UPI001E5DE39D|nr:lycopene beta-cyclase CrtY [Aureimonas altamirensis]UHD47082.1 lycopene beta-cyclase CrtY [Aureimonas altamirensis]
MGGGLAGGLAAYRLATLRPEIDVLLLESGQAAGGNHTWSFHAGDLSPAQHRWLSPFVDHRWPRYEVRFPRRARVIETGYASISSLRFSAVLREALGDRLICGVPVRALRADGVDLADGRSIAASAVVDARGYRPDATLDVRFQKFVGLELSIGAPGPKMPIVMDATVPQKDGYRFVYTLPFAEDRILVEDTYYSDGPETPEQALADGIRAYAQSKGWSPAEILRREAGVLPIALGGDLKAYLAQAGGVVPLGLRAGLFHPTTGYSLPDAVHTADLIATQPDIATPPLAAAVTRHSLAEWRARRIFRLLNRLLFLGAGDGERRDILEHFHRLPDTTIARFYAARLSSADIIRIFAGKPPMPVRRALSILMDGRAAREAS